MVLLDGCGTALDGKAVAGYRQSRRARGESYACRSGSDGGGAGLNSAACRPRNSHIFFGALGWIELEVSQVCWLTFWEQGRCL